MPDTADFDAFVVASSPHLGVTGHSGRLTVAATDSPELSQPLWAVTP